MVHELVETLHRRRTADDAEEALVQIERPAQGEDLFLLPHHLADVGQRLHRPDHLACGVAQHGCVLEDAESAAAFVGDQAAFGGDGALAEESAPGRSRAAVVDFATRALENAAVLADEFGGAVPRDGLGRRVDGENHPPGVDDDEAFPQRVQDRFPEGRKIHAPLRGHATDAGSVGSRRRVCKPKPRRRGGGHPRRPS